MRRPAWPLPPSVCCSLPTPPDPAVPGDSGGAFVTLRKCGISGPFGESLIAALEDFDPEHVEATALTLAADTKAEPNARRIATEILARSRNIRYVEPLLALFEDDGNATNGPVGLHAAQAVSKILAAANRADPKVALCVGWLQTSSNG